MIESISRPYRFHIEKMRSLESTSKSKSFDIKHNRTRITDRLEAEITLWYESIGHKYSNEANFEELVIKELEKIQPLIIQEIGQEALSNCTPQLYFIAEKLMFQIYFNGFEPIEIEVPIAEVENFKENFENIVYSDHTITFNDLNLFVITEINVYDPNSDVQYAYQMYNSQLMLPPTFSISLPSEEP